MRETVMAGLFASVLIIGLAGQASAVEVCLGLDKFGNIFRLEVTPMGVFFSLNGRDRVYAERAVTGTAYFEPGTTNVVRIGITSVANDGGTHSDGVFNAQIDLATGTGPISGFLPSFGTKVADTASIIPCTTPITTILPDINAK